MKTIRHLLFLMCLLCLPLAPMLFIGGCSSVNRSAYVGANASRITVETAMKGFNYWVKDQRAKGKDTTEVERKVFAAFQKWKQAQIALADAGRLQAVYLSTNTAGGTGISAAFEDLTGNAAQYKTDLLDLLASIGLKF
jgi:hypothetical protein